jgi:hypothetical protein
MDATAPPLPTATVPDDPDAAKAAVGWLPAAVWPAAALARAGIPSRSAAPAATNETL